MLRQAQHERKIRNDFRTGPVRPEPVEGRVLVSALHFKKETYTLTSSLHFTHHVSRLLFLQRFRTRFSTKPWQIMVERYPVDTVGKVIVGLGRTIDFTFEIGENNIDVLRMISRFTEERAAAYVTERAPAVIRGAIDLQMILASGHAELRIGNADPGNVPSPMHATAHGAVTMGTKKRWEGYFKFDGPTKTFALDGNCVFDVFTHERLLCLEFRHHFTGKVFDHPILRL